MKFFFTLFLTVLSINISAQRVSRFTVSGFVTDSMSSENLIGATVHKKEDFAGTSTNQYGFYSLTLPAGEVTFVYSYLGYKTQEISFTLVRDTVININLAGTEHLRELEVTASRTARIHETTQMSYISLPVTQIKSLPALMGEVDVMKTLQLMPGIQSGGEGSSGLYVRGGGPDQNLILLDGVPIYNVSHLFGFVSLFNGDAINNIEALKGGFPARYGGRTSSVVDISLKEGNMQKFQGEGSIGIISSKLTLEGPIIKDRTSFIVTGRRTYIDLLAAPLIAHLNKRDSIEQKLGYHFYDLTAKINHRISERDRIYLSAYLGDDKFHIGNDYQFNHDNFSGGDKVDVGIQWGNITAALRWNRIFTNRLFGNATLTYSRYRLNIVSKNERTRTQNEIFFHDYYQAQNNSNINDWSGKVAFDYVPSPKHYVRFGVGAIYHTFSPGTVTIRDINEIRELGSSKLYAWEYSAYLEDDIHITTRLKTNAGLHWSAFATGDEFYNILQPRISLRYLINPQFSAKASYSRMAQYIHLLASSGLGLPMDLWVPSSEKLRPQTSDQIAVGFAQNFMNDYEISLEGYYKTMANVMEYREGATSLFEIDEGSWEQKILQGFGRSYGVELFAQKKTGTFTGWAGYTLSWTDRHFDELNNGKRFPYKYDRRHDVSITLMQRFGKNKKNEISGAWVFGTGNSVTVPIGIYDMNHPIIQINSTHQMVYYDYGERNGYRMKPYHRLDVSIAFIKQTKWGERRWILSIYNVYNRYNPFYVDIEEVETRHSAGIRQYKLVQYSLFPIIPSISYNFKF